jgi:hypothetical protein
MPSFVRNTLCAALVGAFAAQAAPAKAEFSYLSPAQTRAQKCQQTKRAGDFANSLSLCLAAAALFKSIGDGEKINPWYSYEVEGQMLEAAALDYAALNRHQEALDTALQAHRLLLYIYKNYKMDPDDYADIAAITARLAKFEAAERRKL